MIFRRRSRPLAVRRPGLGMLLLAAPLAVLGCGSEDVGGPGSGSNPALRVVIGTSDALWGVVSDFDDARQIATGNIRSPRLSPSRRQIAFIDLEADEHRKVRVVNTGGGTAAEADLGTDVPVSVAWSEDGTYLYFSTLFNAYRWRWKGGADPVHISFIETGDDLAQNPVNQTLAIARNGDIWLQPNYGGPGVNLTGELLYGWEEKPRWSPDGSEILFMASFNSGDPGNGVYVVRPDGTGLRQITEGEPPHYHRAVFRPDGDALLAHRTHPVGGDELVVLSLDGAPADSVWGFPEGMVVDFDWR